MFVVVGTEGLEFKGVVKGMDNVIAEGKLA